MPATSTVRTVAEVMSSPASPPCSSETVAEASRSGWPSTKTGSVVVVDGERPIGILTERDLVRFGAAGAAAAGHEGQRVDDRAEPDCVAPDAVGAGGVRTRSPSTATATSPSSRTARSSASCRCAT